MNKYHETMIKSFHDAMESLTLQEREEYDMLHREQEHWWFQQNQDEEQESGYE